MTRTIPGGGRQRTSDDSGESAPLVAVATAAVTFLTLGVGFSLLALGNPFFWIAFPVGFGSGMPLAVGLAKWYKKNTEADSNRSEDRQTDAALADLRDRYARGQPRKEQR